MEIGAIFLEHCRLNFNSFARNLDFKAQFVEFMSILEAYHKQRLPNLIGGQPTLTYICKRRERQDSNLGWQSYESTSGAIDFLDQGF